MSVIIPGIVERSKGPSAYHPQSNFWPIAEAHGAVMSQLLGEAVHSMQVFTVLRSRATGALARVVVRRERVTRTALTETILFVWIVGNERC